MSARSLLVVSLLVGSSALGALAGCKPASGDNARAVEALSQPPAVDRATEGAVAEPPGAQTEPIPREHYYSPFLLTTRDDYVFKTITFTDVGIKQPEPGPVDELLLETIAESLALHIAESERLGFTPQVEYDEALVDPNNHLFCEEHHLYIAVWRGYAPERWGYSLWSGCSEEHQFAWKEVPSPPIEGSDLVAAVAPLTASIVETLAQATHHSCFHANCTCGAGCGNSVKQVQ